MEGCAMARRELPAYGLTESEVEAVCGMIMATRLPQTPHNKLERIIADADLEYLGTDGYWEIAELLYTEMRHSNPKLSRDDWDKIQASFMQQHRYFTEFCIKHRAPKKQQNLMMLLNG
jgi:uncharacterized protein